MRDVDTLGARSDSFTALAGRQAGRYGDKPLLTWYDDHRGDRVELSFKTFDNWVAKTANLVVDEFGAEPGDRVAAVLAGHWQTPVILAASWRAGVTVVALDPEADPATATGGGGFLAAFVHEELLATAGATLAGGGTVLVALTADPLGRAKHDLGTALHYARVVATMADLFPGGTDPPGEALRVVGPGRGVGAREPQPRLLGPPVGERSAPGQSVPATIHSQAATMAELLDLAAEVAAGTGLGEADRVLSGLGLLSPAGAAVGLLAPFAAGAGVVLAKAFQPARFWQRVAEERVTVAVLEPAQAAALLAAGPPPAELDRSRLRLVACQGAGDAVAAGFATTFGVPLLRAD
jgi:uncharacterized protein (TIGR03089 family)